MATQILDNSALAAFLFDESGADHIQGIFEKAAKRDTPVLVAHPSLAELKRDILLKRNGSGWEDAKAAFSSLPLEFVPTTAEVVEIAGEIHAKFDVGLASAFAVALTKTRKGELTTANPELKAVELGIKINLIE